jgi:hypothetical protein
MLVINKECASYRLHQENNDPDYICSELFSLLRKEQMHIVRGKRHDRRYEY